MSLGYDKRSPQLDPGDGRFDARDFLLLSRIKLLLSQTAKRPFVGIGGIVATVLRYATTLKLGNMGRYFIEQITVMGDDDNAARLRADDALQGPFRRQIKVIIRLVEEEKRWLQYQEFGQHDKLFLAAAQMLR